MSDSIFDLVDTIADSSAERGLRELSPLWMLGNTPNLEQFFRFLTEVKEQLLENEDTPLALCFSRSSLQCIRIEFANMIRAGEERLHRLAQILADSLISECTLQSAVIGEVVTTGERFTLSQSVDSAIVLGSTDIELGNRQLQKLLFFDGAQWSKAELVSNVVEYLARTSTWLGIHRILSRVKAEEEIWNKVVDELFDLDHLVRKDKKLEHLSHFVKDVFGLKIVVGREEDAYRVQETLLAIEWTPEFLRDHGVDPCPAVERLRFVETKEYLRESKKKSGWRALKSVVRWGGGTFEIQVQPLKNYLAEKERLTSESHASFKVSREELRDSVAKSVPLFGFYRDLLRWLFLVTQTPASSSPPRFRNLTLMIEK